ncbi:MAG: VWA domain-containing protein [Anaerolineales bacterium]|nr:VWA domain-containing protein [Anaerolineales bacterium]
MNFMTLPQFQFASPWLLSLLLVLPALALWLAYRQQKQRQAGLTYAYVELARTAGGRSFKTAVRPLVGALKWVALALLVVALARPQTVDAQQSITGEGVDIALALDISGSMASLDFEPQNRLEASKAVIEQFVAERPYDRIGLAVFASEAFAQAPLTTDHEVLRRLLGDVALAPDLNIDDGTAVGLGLANAANMLKTSDADSKVIILLTDGVNNSGEIDPITAAEAARALGIRVYTIGAGRPGMVPVPQDTIFGEQVVMMPSEIDEATLQQIADITGGQYFRAENTAGLQQVYDAINQLEKSEVEIKVFAQYNELAAWLILPALLLLAAELFLQKTIFRRLP